MVWSRIPFATANLVTACTAIRANLGVAFYAYIFAILAGAWSVVWALALIGVFDRTYDCDECDWCVHQSQLRTTLSLVSGLFLCPASDSGA